MKNVNVMDKFIEATREKGTILCVGLDTEYAFLPDNLKKGVKEGSAADIKLLFNKRIIDAVGDCVVAIKLNPAFYVGHWYRGFWVLEKTIEYAKNAGILVILDARTGDGEDSAKAYAEAYLGKRALVDIDAITIQGWIAYAGVLPFIEVARNNGKGIFVVDNTSFSPKSKIGNLITQNGIKTWEELAIMVREWGEGTEGEHGYPSVGVVMGATCPEDATRMREILPNAMFLVPGYGAQGGGADGAVRGVNKDGLGGIVSSSRSILYAFKSGPFQCDDKYFAEAAGKAARLSRDELNAALISAGKISW